MFLTVSYPDADFSRFLDVQLTWDETMAQNVARYLAEHPEIVLGASIDYPPMVIKRADGTHVGVLVDLFEEVNRELNTKVRLHIEDSWADVQEKAQNREIDGLAFGGRDPNRNAIYNATDRIDCIRAA